MSRMKDAKERAERYAEEHKKAFEDWPHGGIENAGLDDNGNFCIVYESGTYYRYKETPDGLKWW